MRVLIVDDDDDCRRVLRKFMEPLAQCDVAGDGLEAIIAFRRAWAEQQPYDLVFLDIRMPRMDGHDTLAEIRRLEQEEYSTVGRGTTRVIMTTALGDRDNVRRAKQEHCEAYIVKPVRLRLLQDQLRKLGLVEQQGEKVIATTPVRSIA